MLVEHQNIKKWGEFNSNFSFSIQRHLIRIEEFESNKNNGEE